MSLQEDLHRAIEIMKRQRAALQWFIDNDDTNRGDYPIRDLGNKSWDEVNAFWIKGLEEGEAAVKDYDDFMKEIVP